MDKELKKLEELIVWLRDETREWLYSSVEGSKTPTGTPPVFPQTLLPKSITDRLLIPVKSIDELNFYLLSGYIAENRELNVLATALRNILNAQNIDAVRDIAQAALARVQS